jgi:hypothetical protein
VCLDVTVFSDDHVFADVTKTAYSCFGANSCVFTNNDVIPNDHISFKLNVFANDHAFAKFGLMLHHAAQSPFSAMTRIQN